MTAKGREQTVKSACCICRGFVPIFHDASSTDTRYLGVRVDPMLIE